MRYLILGNGVAGTYAAKAIREVDEQGEITIISREPYPFYFRPRLPDLLAGEITPAEIEVFKSEWYPERKISLILNETIIKINPTAKNVETKSDVYSYDKLLIALGGRSQLPPIAGLDGDGVFTLHDVDDALRLNELCEKYKKVVLIGGGLLGLEAGFGLIKLGAQVKVVEFFDRLLPRQMDKEGADLLQLRLEKLGFEFRIGAATQSVAGQLGDKKLQIKDSDGLSGQLVLVSAGIRANIEIPQTTGIECGRGVVVNSRMETSLADIYAAGDVAEFEGRVYGLWPAGMAQGRVAGLNMAGGDETYQGTSPSNTLKVAGIDLASWGQIADFTEPVTEYKKVDSEKMTYAKIFLRDGIIKGGIFLGERKLACRIEQLLKKETKVRGFEEKLLDESFDYTALK